LAESIGDQIGDSKGADQNQEAEFLHSITFILSSLNKMASNDRQNIADDQFDDAKETPSDTPPVDPREGGHFVDDETLLEWSEESAADDNDDDDDDMIDQGYDDNRVEDEDWEIAEGGMLITN
jgi:hypothetical protein